MPDPTDRDALVRRMSYAYVNAGGDATNDAPMAHVLSLLEAEGRYAELGEITTADMPALIAAIAATAARHRRRGGGTE